MADELDVVDIEGDEYDASVGTLEGDGLLQNQFLESAWKTSTGILPWELDSTITAENREVIENMLLEEQYYLTGKEMPKNVWPNNSTSKPKVKKSPAKLSAPGSSSRWSQQEKELFEIGLTQFGRRWTKISKLLGSRTVLQVKSYARQYFKQKDKSEPSSAAPPSGEEVQGRAPESSSSHAAALANAVRIERLSDDEEQEVDITDDLSDEGGGGGVLAGEPPHGEVPRTEPEQGETSLGENVQGGDTQDQSSHNPPSPLGQRPRPPCPSPVPCPEQAAVPGQAEVPSSPFSDLQAGEEGEPHQSQPESPEEECHGDSNHAEEGEDQEEEEEEEELKAPEQEVQLDAEAIAEEEKQAFPEFFEGRPSKTPERYLKIRNYILDQWVRSKPRYLNKTSVRPGLKNCGDVNCIGRIHTYLELIGAINFNCEQAVYNRPRVVDRARPREGRDALDSYQLAQRLQSMRTRKRRVRDLWGNWCDPKDLEGQTYEHLSAEELRRREEELSRQPRPSKVPRLRGFDPFQLIPCRAFGEDRQEPFQVIVCAEALLIMDMHAHVSRCEVIGLLGGAYNEEDKVLQIFAAEPCNSVSTGLQCEMDPLSQTQACEQLSALGHSVVGWYHSHPTFHPNPSLRDIHTQDQFQSYFSRGGAPFIGMIVSPYDPANTSPHSHTTCLVVSTHQGHAGPQKLPYRFDFLSSQEVPDWGQMTRRAQWIVQKYAHTHGRVHMSRMFRRDSHLTCLEKMLSSLARYLEPLADGEGDPFLTHVQTLFQSQFAVELPINQDEGRTSSSPEEPADTDSFPFSEPGGGGGAETTEVQDVEPDWDPESPPLPDDTQPPSPFQLNLGSVLLTGHDYLL
ncbi:histone H2A deubiquitinase MYSM1 [Osmerus mordax]|uniref:histone H2A deubiquitinase MYSM1 n=1 Tax=Osmerus mordax TaxID=8014 RepID=UPI00350F411C